MQTEILPLKEDRANPGQGPTSPEKENKSPRKSSAKGHTALAKSMPVKHKAPAEDDSNPKQSQRSPIQDSQDTNIRKTMVVKKERKKQTEKAAAEDFLKGISFGDPKKELPKKVKKPTIPVQPLYQSSQIERETVIPSTTPLATSLGQSFVSAPAPDELVVEERPMPVIEEVHDDEEQQAKKKSSTKKKLVIKGANLKKYKSKLVNSTMYFTSSHQSYPIVSSLIVTSDAKLATPARTTSFERPSFSRERSSTIEDNTRPQLKTSAAVVKKPSKGTAYGYLLPQHDEYNPHFLDNSFVLPNKQRMVINLPGFRESFFPFVKASHLEEELDSEFKEKHPWLKTNLTLNDIRKMKRRLFDVSLSVSLDVSTTALSYVYFERLIVKNLVTKNNMKSYAAACLLLAAKFNNPREFAKRVFEAIDRTFVPARDVTSIEFMVYKDLAFKLMADMSDVEPHIQQLQASQDYQDHLFEYQARRRKGSARDSIYGELPNTGKQAANSQ